MRSIVLGLALTCAISACGPSDDELKTKEQALEGVRAENTTLRTRISDLEKQLAAEKERPDRLLAGAQQAFDKRDYGGAVAMAERLLELHPGAREASTARRIASRGRSNILEAARRAEAEAEKQRKREVARAEAADREKIRKLRADLHRNLDGVGGGFVRRWELGSDSFVLVIDQTKYAPNSAIAASMTARAIFESNGVRLPSQLVFRDTAGNVIDSGPFANVPSVTQ